MARTTGNAALQPGESSTVSRPDVVRDDRVFQETRWIGACIPPFLIVAFIMLYFFPNNTDTLFAWTIKPTMTPLMMGGGYISGSYFFVRLVMGGRWHWFTHGFPAIATFTWFMGLATFLHLEKFHPAHISFYAWLGLYVVTPFLVPILWLRNRVTDPHTPDPVDVVVPDWIRLASRVVGAGLLLIAVLMFIFPNTIRSIWPWTLTPLTTRVVGGWFALPGVVALMLSTDRRWSAWKILIESQMIGILLILVGAARAWANFNAANPTTWLFVGGMALLLLAVLGLYISMQTHRQVQKARLSEEKATPDLQAINYIRSVIAEEHKMARYSFITIWRIEAPIDKVWEALYDSERWPSWWKGVEKVVELKKGDKNGIGSVQRYTWKSKLPYRLAFDMRLTKNEKPSKLEGAAQGELTGTGRWELEQDGPVTTARYYWDVSTTKWWMNLLTPIARPLFKWNHDVVMAQGAEGLARLLGAKLLSGGES